MARTAGVAGPGCNAWACFSSIDDTVSAGVRYKDELGVKYAYDSTVANHKALKVGDLLVIRDSVLIYGHGIIEEVLRDSDRKIMELCPSCRASGPSARVRMLPKYRCPDCKEEFSEPLFEEREVQRSEARYGSTWAPLATPVPRALLDPVYVGADRQNAIRALNVAAAVTLLEMHTSLDGLADLRDFGYTGGGNPSGGHVLAQGRRRLGQREFKKMLVERFGSACAVTGPQPLAILDAAHLYRFAKAPEHHLDGGLLLRADIHRLFDAFMLVVDTADWTVRLSPALLGYAGLADLEGLELQMAIDRRPRREFLDDHRAEAVQRWELSP
jgi:hypothetical protein